MSKFPVTKYIWLTMGVSFALGILALITVGAIDITYGKYVDSKEYGCLLVGLGVGIMFGAIPILIKVAQYQAQLEHKKEQIQSQVFSRLW